MKGTIKFTVEVNAAPDNLINLNLFKVNLSFAFKSTANVSLSLF